MRAVHAIPYYCLLLLLLLSLTGCAGTPSVDQAAPSATPRPTAAALAETSVAPSATPPPATAAPSATPPPATEVPIATPTLAPAASNDPCSQVTRIPPDSAEARTIAQALLAELPKRQASDMATRSFEFDEIRSIDRMGDWVVFQASFKAYLEPAIFVLQATADGYRYDGEGWGGQADGAAEIRSYLASRLPEAPPELFACLEPAEWFILP